jgi:hypothetical protein
MSYSLIDQLIQESAETMEGVNTYQTLEEGPGPDVYISLDMLYENAAKASVRNVILESEGVDADTKIKHLGIIESANLSEEQIGTFVVENIVPMIQITGQWGNPSSRAVHVPMIIFETAMAIGADGFDYEALTEIKEGYDLSDSDMKHVVAEAQNCLEKFGSNIVPNYFDLAEMVLDYNLLAEAEGLSTAAELILEAEGIVGEEWDPDKAAKKAESAAAKAAKEAARAELKPKLEEVNKRIKAAKAAKDEAGLLKARNDKRQLVADFERTYPSVIRRMRIALAKRAEGKWEAVKGAPGKAWAGIQAGAGGVKGAPGKAWAGVQTGYGGVKKAAASRKTAWQSGGWKTKVGVITGRPAVGVAALATIAALVWKKHSGVCRGMSGDEKQACLKAAAMEALKNAQSAARQNPESAPLQKEVEKWTRRVQEYSA